MRRSLFTLVATLPAITACYATLPVDADRLQTGTRVELTLSGRGTDTMASVLGPDVAKVDGDVARITPSTLEVALARTEKRTGFDDLWQHQRIVVPRDAVVSFNQRRLSRTRTWLLAGSAAAVTLLAAWRFSSPGQQPAGLEPPVTPSH
jgi:hypothetical protein